MLLGCSTDEAIQLVGHDRKTHHHELIRVLNNHGARLSENKVLRFPMFGHIETALQRHREPGSDKSHWTVYHDGKVFDPACMADLWPAVSYVPIQLDVLRRDRR